ncbi:DUF4307 domain-containing protein [Thermostaphylospora chromogena]|uniref:DUF4307 domain-containing protein n=1 Tax=Thermostaphylospora chromogena TaxID=35622 RepID=A0A1H1B6C8_9ACTN|nr:DUF4307 domain-containing protein [Thermostaphylospora chromogena]SDQ47487.1 protein of unknown function [Thermostaphylospora chromogena]
MATSKAGEGWPHRPILGTPDDPSERPDAPARRGRFVVHLVIGVLVAIVAFGWGYVMWAAKGDTEVIDQVITFDTGRSDQVEITFEVYKPAEEAALCRLRATDVDHVEVGTKEVRIPAGESHVVLTERLDTSAQATSVHVHYCYLV